MKGITIPYTIHMQRKLFDEYIWDSFVCFLNIEGNHYETEDGGKYLKDGIEFRPLDVINRNPSQVSDLLWKEVLLSHLRNRYN